MIEFGTLEGEVCWRNGCQGILLEAGSEDCSCHIAPPCGSCTTPREFCPECDWHAKDEGEKINGFIENKGKTYPLSHQPIWERRPLDPRKLDYHCKSTGTGFTMVKEGVYPEGMTRETIEREVRGTFGGRFEYFGGGKFKYTCYTD